MKIERPFFGKRRVSVVVRHEVRMPMAGIVQFCVRIRNPFIIEYA